MSDKDVYPIKETQAGQTAGWKNIFPEFLQHTVCTAYRIKSLGIHLI